MHWEEAKDVEQKILRIVSAIKNEFSHIQPERIFCFRTQGSKSRSYARIWSFPKIFQRALGIEPAYVIEVLSCYFDNLSDQQKDKVLIHELLHIPKNFSGALLAHRSRGRHMTYLVKKLHKQYMLLLNL